MFRFTSTIVFALLFKSAIGQDFSYSVFNDLVFNKADSAVKYVQYHLDKCDCEPLDSANYLHILGAAYWAKGDLIIAAEYLTRSISKFEGLVKAKSVAGVHLALGNVFNDMKANRLAISSYHIAIKSQPEFPGGYNNLGTVYLRMGQLDSAEYLFRKSTSLPSFKKNTQHEVYFTSNMGELMTKRKQYGKALSYLQRADSLTDVLKDNKMKAIIRKNWAVLAMHQRQYSEALEQAYRSKDLAFKGNFRETIRDVHQVLYEIHSDLNNPDSALFYLEKTNQWNDSLTQKSGTQISDFLLDFFQEKRQKEKALAQVKELKLNQEIEAERNEKYLYSLIALLVLAIGINIWGSQRLRIQRQGLKLQLGAEKTKRMQAEVMGERLKAEEASRELHYREKELLTYALKEAEMQNFLIDLHSEVEKLAKDDNRKLIEIQSRLALQLNEENRWDDFKLQFEKVHDSFFTSLIKKHPELTANDLKLAALTLLNLSTKEIALIQGVKHTSIDIARHRLKKKMNFEGEQSLIKYLRSFT